jgi:hypothetical protein
MLGIAISVYDKFEELRLLLDVLRENFRTPFVVVVCSNSERAAAELGDAPIDRLVEGEAIHFSPQLDWRRQGRPNLVCRVCDTIQKSCGAAMELGATHVMHVHSDAWPLREKKLLAVFDRVRGSEKVLAARGLGFGFHGNDVPLGTVDDMFFCFETEWATRVGFFDFDPLAMLPHKLSIHGILAALILTKAGLSGFDHYCDQSNMEMWPGRMKPLPVLPAFPSHYDLDHGFLHVHRQAYPGHLGERIQAHYLSQLGHTRGRLLPEFVSRWCGDERELVRELEDLRRDSEHKMRLLGLDPAGFGGDYAKMQHIWSGHGHWRGRMLGLVRKSRHAAQGWGRRLLGRDVKPTLYRHADSVWPTPIDEYYRETIDRAHYPRDRVWFDRPER